MVISQDLYPFKRNFHAIGQHRQHYIDEGKGDPILMVHGNPTWSFYYRNLARHFAKTHRVIVPDHMGCGFSDHPTDEEYHYTLEQRVADLTKLVQELGLKNITLVVHDWGGMIGFTFATRFPDLIKQLVVFNTAAFHNPKGLSLPLSIGICRTKGIGPLLVRGFNAFSRGATLTCCTKKVLSKEEKKGYLAPYSNWRQRRAVLRFVQDIPLKPKDEAWSVVAEVQENLGRLKGKPMLIAWGGKDFVFDDSFLEQWQQHYPQAEVHYFQEAGHFIVEDAEREVIGLMDQFLTRH